MPDTRYRSLRYEVADRKAYVTLDRPERLNAIDARMPGGIAAAVERAGDDPEVHATFGVYCRRWGVPLVDGGTIRLPRLIGHSRALDMVLTGRAVAAPEALAIGLANRVVPAGGALPAAVALAAEIAAFPKAACAATGCPPTTSGRSASTPPLLAEYHHGIATIHSGETAAGAGRFAAGEGRHGTFSHE